MSDSSSRYQMKMLLSYTRVLKYKGDRIKIITPTDMVYITGYESWMPRHRSTQPMR